jgi:integrase
VDLERTPLLVHSNLVWAGNKVYFEEAETRYSRRRIGLPKTAVEALRRHRARQASERLRLGAAWPDLDLVFSNRAGRPYHPDDIRRRHFYPLLERAGLPQIRVHDLRHTAAALLLARGVNVKVVSEMLGHANVSMTLSIDSHVLPHMQQHAVDMMDAMLHRPLHGTPDVQGSNQGSAATR